MGDELDHGVFAHRGLTLPSSHGDSWPDEQPATSLYIDSGLWVRPYAMFVEDVELGGHRQPRFAPST